MVRVPPKVIEFVKNKDVVKIDDLIREFAYKRGTVYQYFSSLTKRGVTVRVGRGLYKAAPPTKQPEPSPLSQEIYATIKKRLPQMPIVVWDVYMLSAFSHYSIMKSPIFVEVPKGFVDAVKNAILEQGIRYKELPVFDISAVDIKEVFDLTPILLEERNEKYGTVEIEGIRTVRPERAWIDLFLLKERKGYPFDEASLGEMLYRMIRDFNFNTTLFLRYAQRREARPLLESLLALIQKEKGVLSGISFKHSSGRQAKLKAFMRGVRDENVF